MSRPTTLADLAREGLGTVMRGDPGTEVLGVQHDSRAVHAKDLFVAVPGALADGTRFAADAVARGASAVMTERVLDIEIPQIVVENARRALALAAAVVYGQPTFSLDVIGITGTNGKTTVSYLVESALASMDGVSPAVMGTVSLRGPTGERPAPHTTPEGDEIARFAREVLDAGATHLVMEVSSHALALHRVDAVQFRVAAFTNLSQDHLDFHSTMDEYFRAKEKLFTDLAPATAVINVDDSRGAELAKKIRTKMWRCSTRPDAGPEVRVLWSKMERSGLSAEIATPLGAVSLKSPLLGSHNLENLVVALGCGLALEMDPHAFARGLSKAVGAPGRLERIEHPGDIAVFVDYAHTPDALGRVLSALRPVTPGRLILVFGCGGDRDQSKRPVMGEVAGSLADLVVLTSDNPRTEVASKIIEDVLPGIARVGKAVTTERAIANVSNAYITVEDRRQAINVAIQVARPGDTVLIAGKGHEDYQIVGTQKLPFDDRVEASRAINQLRGGQG